MLTELVNRRIALQTMGLGAVHTLVPAAGRAQPAPPVHADQPLPVAAVVTAYKRNSHADVLIGKILEGWRQDGGPGPGLKLVSLYTDQVPTGDLSRDLAVRHGFHIAKSIDEALTLGKDQLAVRGVLCVGEHGNYPYHEQTGQHMYPRRRFFDQSVAAMRRCGQFVPLFNDKHLAYNWRDARHMYDVARRYGIPFLAGSSVPVAWRYPAIQLPRNSPIQEAVAVGYGGVEAYGFHALEALQCFVERRQGGETGVKSVTAWKGDAIWQAEREGRWSRELVAAALETSGGSAENLEQRLNVERSALFHIEHTDGLRSTLAMLNGVSSQFAVCCRLSNQPRPVASWMRLEEVAPFGHFAYLLQAIEATFRTKRPAYPLERTLLTTGILDRAMHSLARNGETLAAPELAISYQPTDWPFANQLEENFPIPADSQ